LLTSTASRSSISGLSTKRLTSTLNDKTYYFCIFDEIFYLNVAVSFITFYSLSGDLVCLFSLTFYILFFKNINIYWLNLVSFSITFPPVATTLCSPLNMPREKSTLSSFYPVILTPKTISSLRITPVILHLKIFLWFRCHKTSPAHPRPTFTLLVPSNDLHFSNNWVKSAQLPGTSLTSTNHIRPPPE
jgi:hypothetical protein